MPHVHPALAALTLLLADDRPFNPAGAGTAGPDLTRYLIVCGSLLLLVGGLAWGARRFLARTLKARAGKRALQVLDLLGLQANDNFNLRMAEHKAVQEAASLSGRDLFFALFNQGASRVALQDYAGAASAFDTALVNYEHVPQEQRPWRMMWYQTGPYWAYFHTGRYQDVIDLATKTLDNMSEPILEERRMAPIP